MLQSHRGYEHANTCEHLFLDVRGSSLRDGGGESLPTLSLRIDTNTLLLDTNTLLIDTNTMRIAANRGALNIKFTNTMPIDTNSYEHLRIATNRCEHDSRSDVRISNRNFFNMLKTSANSPEQTAYILGIDRE